MKISILILSSILFAPSLLAGQIDKKEIEISSFDAYLSGKLGDEKGAEEASEKIVSYYAPILDNPASPKKDRIEALNRIARVKIEQNRFDDILRLSDSLLSEYPNEPKILETKAQIHQLYASDHLSRSEYDAALREYESALDLNNLPEELYALTKDNIAHAYVLKSDSQNALYWYNRIIEDHPGLKNWPACACYSIADYYLTQNNPTKAKEYLQRIITDYPSSGWVKPAQDKLSEIGVPRLKTVPLKWYKSQGGGNG